METGTFLYNETDDEWTLQSGFDGGELLARPSIRMMAVDADVIRRAEKMIIACEHCHPEDAYIPFDWALVNKVVCEGRLIESPQSEIETWH
jgi:hypothetical protein